MCAQLLRHMHGTKRASDGWQVSCSTLLLSLGFTQGDGLPNIFHNAEKMIATLVRADDFMLCGPKPALYWMEAFIAEHYEIKVVPRMGHGPQDAKDGPQF